MAINAVPLQHTWTCDIVTDVGVATALVKGCGSKRCVIPGERARDDGLYRSLSGNVMIENFPENIWCAPLWWNKLTKRILKAFEEKANTEESQFGVKTLIERHIRIEIINRTSPQRTGKLLKVITNIFFGNRTTYWDCLGSLKLSKRRERMRVNVNIHILTSYFFFDRPREINLRKYEKVYNYICVGSSERLSCCLVIPYVLNT